MKINSLKSLRMETERLNYKIKVDRDKLVTEIKLLRYHFLEYALKGVLGLFMSKKNKEKSTSKSSKKKG